MMLDKNVYLWNIHVLSRTSNFGKVENSPGKSREFHLRLSLGKIWRSFMIYGIPIMVIMNICKMDWLNGCWLKQMIHFGLLKWQKERFVTRGVRTTSRTMSTWTLVIMETSFREKRDICTMEFWWRNFLKRIK